MEIREHDLKECQLLFSGADPQELVEISLENSLETFEIRREGKLLVVGGVAEISTIPGFQIWAIGTPAMDELKNQLKVLRDGRKILKAYLEKYYRLSNWCSADPGQLGAMRQLGFEIIDTENPEVKFITVCA